MNPVCSIILLSYNQLAYTKMCLESIRTYTDDILYEIIVVDNHSTESECIPYLENQRDIRLIKNEINRGFASGCNQGIEASRGKYIVLLNNDTIVTSKWLSNMVDMLERHEDLAMVGPLTNATVGKQMISVDYGDDMETMQRFSAKISQRDSQPWRTLRLVFFCVVIRRSVLTELGLLDEGFKIGNYEDDDYCIRLLLADKKMCICRNSFIHHFMNVSFHQKLDRTREQIMFQNKGYLEVKWNNLDWNYHAVYNDYMLREIRGRKKGKICHIGCGVGALEIELMDNGCKFEITGFETHEIRRTVASKFINNVYPLDIDFQNVLIDQTFDFIIIEGTLEMFGLVLLDKIKIFSAPYTQIYLRVFNCRHITSVEKAVMGQIEGDLLCAEHSNFYYRFDNNLEKDIRERGFEIEEVKEIRKSFSTRQSYLFEKLKNVDDYAHESVIYNRIYKLKLNI